MRAEKGKNKEKRKGKETGNGARTCSFGEVICDMSLPAAAQFFTCGEVGAGVAGADGVRAGRRLVCCSPGGPICGIKNKNAINGNACPQPPSASP